MISDTNAFFDTKEKKYLFVVLFLNEGRTMKKVKKLKLTKSKNPVVIISSLMNST